MKGFFKFLFSATIGLAYGLLFAQKSGKKFREELRTSSHPGKMLLGELKKIDHEARGTVADWAKNSKELQEVLETGKHQFDIFVEKVSVLGHDAAEVAEKELESLSHNAKKAAEELKKQMKSKGAELGRTVAEQTRHFKNELDQLKKLKKTKKASAKKKTKKKVAPKKKK